jgi:hypothetical protein
LGEWEALSAGCEALAQQGGWRFDSRVCIRQVLPNGLALLRQWFVSSWEVWSRNWVRLVESMQRTGVSGCAVDC